MTRREPALAIFLASLRVAAAIGPHPVERWQISEDALRVVYADRMTDGSIRSSEIIKPRAPEYPARVALVATNEQPAAWQLVYEARYAGGRVATNLQTVLKTQARDRLLTRHAPPPGPGRQERPSPARDDALGQAKARALPRSASATPTNAVARMAASAPRVVRSEIVNGRVLHTLADGRAEISPLRLAHTARVASAPAAPAADPGGGAPGTAGAAAAGAAAGAAALAAAQAIARRSHKPKP